MRALLAIPAAALLAACAEPEPVSRDELPFEPSYQGIETRLLDGDLVSFRVTMQGARDNQDVAEYAECAAAQYTVIRGYRYARHVRTNVAEQRGVWYGDAVYTISPALPEGLKTIDAGAAVETCAETGIPTV
ncbi:hypothetical protein [Pseudoruegeria sp. SHC-113]|uniref:hypothetical protein n=1 Tax=Pseudoruegeria sp. SHC-113 TaxID=2855439 RepID=UPI0021BB6023|nr:hypothetical protein [Pseudoruegeria sp. SHC-113]MCT8161162.1 hypothetical protein [Pseudoruegeria sp. SHC-113]